jgi:hypothetical protein
MQPLDITDRIREHAERLDSETSPVLFTDLRGPQSLPLAEAARGTPRPLRGWMVAAGSAFSVLLLVGGSIALLNLVGGESEPDAATVTPTVTTTIDSPPTTEGISPTTVAAPVAPPETPPTVWTRVDTDMVAQSAAAGPFGILAIDRSMFPDVLLWSSSDGMTWDSSSWGGTINYSPTEASVDTITYAGARYLVFGGHWGIDLRSSINGVDWIAADHIDEGNSPAFENGEPTPGTYGHISQIAYGNDTYVAVGDVRDHGEDSYSNPRAAVWTSSDALTWTRLPDDEEVFDGPWHQEMSDVVFGDSGFVSVGSTEGDDGQSSVGALWHSPDGIAWTRITDDGDLFGEQVAEEWHGLWRVAFGDGKYVAVGSRGRILISDDGLSWSQTPSFDFIEDVSSVDIAFGDGSFVIVAEEWTPSQDDSDEWLHAPAIWYSTDAINWERIPNEDGLFGEPRIGHETAGSLSLTFRNGRFVVVGYDQMWPGPEGTPPVYSGHVWLGEPTP